MGGSTKRYDTTPADTSRLRGGIVDYLMGGSGGGRGQTGPTDQFPNKASPEQMAMINRMQPGGGASGFGTQGNGTGSPYDRINAATVNPGQSIDELGGADSPFFKNMIAQYQPAFDQKRKLALAQAKESSGTLTGSGYANTLGTAVNRSLGDENAALAGIAGRGLELESSRQSNIFNQQSESARANAQNFLQLLMGQGLAGVGPDTIAKSGGIGAMLPFLGQLFGTWMGAGHPGVGGGGGTPTGTQVGNSGTGGRV